MGTPEDSLIIPPSPLEQLKALSIYKPSTLDKEPTMDIQSTLTERGKTHGDFTQNSSVIQALKFDMQASANYNSLRPHMREALEMIAHKIGRILCGNPNEPDHWKDIAGYATLVENILVHGTSHPTPTHLDTKISEGDTMNPT